MRFGKTIMSRIGNTPVIKIANVTVSVKPDVVSVVGPKGQLAISVPSGLTIEESQSEILVKRSENSKYMKSLHGALSANLKNAIVGVSTGWTKTLELNGVGYRAALEGLHLVLTVGFSHPVKIAPPAGITFQIADGKIIVSGIDKYAVGQISATIRNVKPPEPYKGKGIRYSGEYIRKKAGKSAKAVGGAGGK